MTPPGGLEPTPLGFPVLRTCPHCGRPLPPVASPVATHAALEAKPGTAVNRAPELEDATPTVAQPVDRRLAETDRMPKR